MPTPSHHLSGCAAQPALKALHALEIRLVVEELTPDERRELAAVAGVGAGVDDAAGDLPRLLAERTASLSADQAHEVGRQLVQPLVPELAAALDTPGLEADAALRLGLAVLVDAWPPALVRLLLELAWEVGELPSELLDLGVLDLLEGPGEGPGD